MTHATRRLTAAMQTLQAHQLAKLTSWDLTAEHDRAAATLRRAMPNCSPHLQRSLRRKLDAYDAAERR